MKKKLIAALTVATIGSASMSSHALDLTTASATGTIAAAIGISQTTPLNFGNIVQNAAGGTVVVSATGAATVFTTVADADGGGGPSTRGVFSVTGQSGATYAVTVPAGTVNLVNGADNIVLSAFTSSNTGTLTGGTDALYVGATGTLDGSEPAGTYTGTYTVTVTYN